MTNQLRGGLVLATRGILSILIGHSTGIQNKVVNVVNGIGELYNFLPVGQVKGPVFFSNLLASLPVTMQRVLCSSR